jgi:hypothetical protein
MKVTLSQCLSAVTNRNKQLFPCSTRSYIVSYFANSSKCQPAIRVLQPFGHLYICCGEGGPLTSVAHESRISRRWSRSLARIVRSRNVSPVSWQSRRFSIGLVVLASARLSRQRSGCYGTAAVWGGIARVLKGLQGAARGYYVSKRMTSEEIRFTPLQVSNTGGDEPGSGQQ